jgi:predicted permease
MTDSTNTTRFRSWLWLSRSVRLHGVGALGYVSWQQLRRLGEDTLRDVRFGTRMLMKRPSFTLIAVLTLGLGIGVNTALFASFNLLLRPTPVKDPDAVVKIECQNENDSHTFSYIEYVYYRAHVQTLADLVPAYEDELLLGEQTSGGAPVEIKAVFTSDNYLSMLGGSMRLGRFFTAEESRVAGQGEVIVLSHYLWQQRFVGDQAVVGRRLLLNGKPFTVIGVTGADFAGLQMEMPGLWLPLTMRAALAARPAAGAMTENRDWFDDQQFRWLSLYARLKPGQTAAEAQEELSLLRDQLPRAAESPGAKNFISVAPAFSAERKESFWLTMAVVLGASSLVLLIACSNMANMLLVRAVARQKEIGVRLALGASRWRVVRQLLTESFLLAVLGGAAGVLLARWSVQLIFPWVFARSDGRDFTKTVFSLSLDWRVLVFALLLSLLSGVAFGLLPALRATRPDLIGVMKDDYVAFGGRPARAWLRNALVVAQVALCFVLLIPAGLLLRALTKILGSERGYAAKNLLVVGYSREVIGKGAPGARQFEQQLIARLAALPDVQSVCPQPDFGGLVRVTLLGEQRPGMAGSQFEQVPFQWVTAGYLNTIGTPLIYGRGFTAEEVESRAPVIIVSQATAQNLWPGANPLDKRVRVEGWRGDHGTEINVPQVRVIGIAGDNDIYRPGHIPPLFFYAPRLPSIWVYREVLVRTAGDAASLQELVRKEALALEPGLRLNVGKIEAVLGRASSINSTRIASELAAGLGGLALVLATLGLYGVMAFAVVQRTREISVRLALGARSGQVQKLMIAQGMRLVLIGVLIGVPLAMAASKVVAGMIFGVSTRDPATYFGVALLLAVAGLTACWIPARRAMRVDPMIALRCE